MVFSFKLVISLADRKAYVMAQEDNTEIYGNGNFVKVEQ